MGPIECHRNSIRRGFHAIISQDGKRSPGSISSLKKHVGCLSTTTWYLQNLPDDASSSPRSPFAGLAR